MAPMIQGTPASGDARAEHGGQHGDGHADDAVEVAAARGLGVGQAAEAQDEEDGGADVGDGGETCGHASDLAYLRNIASMRRVTAKPPNMLTAVSASATTASPRIQPDGLPSRDAVQRRRDLHQRADGDDAGDRVGHAHERRVQRGRHVPDHHVADEAGQHEHREVRRGTRPARRRRSAGTAAAPTPKTAARVVPDIGSDAPWRGLLLQRRAAPRPASPGLAPPTASAAGGGQVTAPSLMTVVPRRTSSSKLTLMVAVLRLAQLLGQAQQVGGVERGGLPRPGGSAGRCSR